MPAGGAQITVTAPVAGTLGADGRRAAVGAHVEKGQVVLTLVPLAPAERDVRIEAERAVAEAVGRQEMAAKRAERARQLARDGSGSQRAAEEAQADLAVADAALKAARDRLALAARGVSASGAIPLDAPHAGAAAHAARDARADRQRRRAAVRPGRRSTRSGCECRSTPATSTPSIDGRRPKSCRSARRRAREAWPPRPSPPRRPPMPRPPASISSTASPIAIGRCSPGSGSPSACRCAPEQDSLVVPRAAVLYDAFGGTWVYEARDGGVFVRQRVALADLVGDTAVLRQGPPPGTRVVTVGAAELFGTEFGVGK